MIFSKNMDLKHLGTRRNRNRSSAWWMAPTILVIVLGYGWLEERDREHQEEVELLANVVHSQAVEIFRMTASDCAPAMDMGMPIQQGTVQL